MSVSGQFCSEVTCELQRIAVFDSVSGLHQRVQHSPEAMILYRQIQARLDPCHVFSKEREDKVKKLLEECTEFSSGIGISIQERLQIKEALKFSGSGHWYKCPNGHVYAIGDCGLANQAAVCPIRGCGTTIGGTGYQLDPSNSLAPEMEAFQI